jgi:hypothetical protein
MQRVHLMTTVLRRVCSSGLVSAGAVLVGLIGITTGTPVLAQEQAPPTTIEGYAVNLDDRRGTADPLISKPLPLSLEIEGVSQKRKLDFDDLGVQSVKIQRMGVYLGVDVTRALTLRGLLGVSELKSSIARSGEDNGDLVWGVDVEGRLINWHVDPTLVNVSWIHFDASARFLNTLSSDDNELGWREGYGDLTVSLVSVPHDKATVRSVTVYAGPAISWLDGTMDTVRGGRDDFSENQLVGFTAGIVVVPHENIKLRVGAEMFDEVSWTGAIQFHF